jgi:hypothetical protein
MRASRMRDEELFQLVKLARPTVALLLKARRHSPLTKKEWKTLRENFPQLLAKMGLKVPLPFQGRVLSWLATHPHPIGRMLGIADIVDTLLELLQRLMVDVDKRFLLKIGSEDPEEMRKFIENFKGYAFEVIARGFLRDIVGGVWRNVEYRLLHDGRDVDAYSEIPREGYLDVYVAEAKAKFASRHVDETEATIKKLVRELRMDRRSSRGFILKTVAIISFRELDDREAILNKAKTRWVEAAGRDLNVECYDPQKIVKLCKDNRPLGDHYLNCIRFAIQALESTGLTSKGYEAWHQADGSPSLCP